MSLVDQAGGASSEGGSTSNAGASEASSTPNMDNSASNNITDQPQSTPDPWFYDENMPGTGTRPDWLKTKYKSATEQAKAYNEIEKKLGAFKGAPEEYDLNIADMPDVKFQKEDPVLSDFLADAKKNNVSQEYVTHLLKTYVNMQAMNMPDPAKEMEKLGVNGAHDIQILAQWGQNNLSSDEFVLFKNMMTTAASVRLFEKLRALSSQPSTQPKNPNTSRETEAEVLAMIHDPRYEQDENYRNTVREKLKQFSS